MGIDTRFYKTACFGVSSFLSGVAGGLGALSSQFVSPDTYAFFLSITLLVGGVRRLRERVRRSFGAAFIVLMPNYAESLWQGAPWAIYGGMTIMQKGIAGLSLTLTSVMAERLPKQKSRR